MLKQLGIYKKNPKMTKSKSGLKIFEKLLLNKNWSCGGSLLAHQSSGAEVLGSNPASPTMIMMRCRIIV